MKQLVTLCWLCAFGLTASIGRAGECGDAAAGNCCQSCDTCCDSCCGKRCELRVGTKKVKVTCFACECEDICLPGPSRKLCTHREHVCSKCGVEGGCSCGHQGKPDFVWSEWCPTKCAKITNVKKLVKREIEKEIPDYKWVVVDCGCQACAGETKPSMPSDPPPVNTTQRRSISKPAPENAQVGESFDLTESEVKQVESQIQQASYGVPARVTAPASKSKVPWSLFGK